MQSLPSFTSNSTEQEISVFGASSDKLARKGLVSRQQSEAIEVDGITDQGPDGRGQNARSNSVTSPIEAFVGRNSKERVSRPASAETSDNGEKTLSKDKQKLVRKLSKDNDTLHQPDDYEKMRKTAESDAMLRGTATAVEDFNLRIAEQQPGAKWDLQSSPQEQIPRVAPEGSSTATAVSPSVVQNAFDRMRPRRSAPEVATITIGSKTTTSVLGASSVAKRRKTSPTPSNSVIPRRSVDGSARNRFSSSMISFAAPGSELLKTVGKSQSKARVSINYPPMESEDEVSVHTSDTESTASNGEPSEEGDGSLRSEVEDSRAYNGADSPPLAAELVDDDEYLNEENKKFRGEAKVAELIRQAEESSVVPSQENRRRAHQILKGTGHRDSTISLVQVIDTSVQEIEQQLSCIEIATHQSLTAPDIPNPSSTTPTIYTTPEERLSLTVSKSDFQTMHIAGQFNLGFILATRQSSDLFIIDQHASDEKYNFERLQATTVVQNQRLVHPRPLQLTAIEEEIVLENHDALLKNGFLVSIDTSGDLPVGQRCKLLTLPMSKEITFTTADLDELITLLADFPSTASTSDTVPRPSKVRRMFAMRACRSSVMIGKTLTMKQMEGLVRRMGGVDKPWNCPHGTRWTGSKCP